MTRPMYSLGHSTKSLEGFVALCRTEGLELICDIRRYPHSRRSPHFSREVLELELPRQGIAYVFVGDELGGFREGGYEAWTQTQPFSKGVAALEGLATERIVGFMCSEGDPSRWHRRFVARILAGRGHRVGHLLPDGSVSWEPSPLMP